MIISHKHRYLFVELPHTGSSTISIELCQYYDGVPILYKHARYHEFLKTADAEEEKYFIFSCIRNPLDTAVTSYFRLKTIPDIVKRHTRWISRRYTLKRCAFIQNTDADFPAYFKKFYRFPYDNWSSLSHKEVDFIIHFENLQDDFSKVLKLLGIDQRRPLPVRNKTAGKRKDFWSYYTPEIRDQAIRVFGPFMKKWGYDFPPEWGDNSIPWLSQVQYDVLGVLRRHMIWPLAQLTRKPLPVTK
jgi:hypothetical protein